MLLAIRSLPLSKTTADAWRSAGVGFIRRRNHNIDIINKVVERSNIRAIINLGNLNLDFSNIMAPIFNHPDSIRSISSALALRKTLNDYIPKQTFDGPHWHKRLGYGGAGKVFHEDQTDVCFGVSGDSQQHIEGIEYRVITVGDVVVQAHRKDGNDSIGNFDWSWCGVAGIKQTGIISLIKEAVERIPYHSTTVFGWDVIVGDSPFVIEINTCPGVNEATARRIVQQIERIV